MSEETGLEVKFGVGKTDDDVFGSTETVDELEIGADGE